MDQRSIERIRKSLEARQRDLRHGLAQARREMLAESANQVMDEGDRANASLARETDVNQKARKRASLDEIDAALRRISEGTFGQCLNCEQEINAQRLEAIPWVRFCITCQELTDGEN